MKVIKFLLVFVLIMTSFLSGYMIHKSQDSYNIDDFKKIQNEVKTIQEDTVLSYIKITDDRIPHNATFLPKGNIISTEETAAQFGYLIAKALYGKEIYRQMPLNIREFGIRFMQTVAIAWTPLYAQAVPLACSQRNNTQPMPSTGS